jgi:hypothetical protein
MISLLKHWKVIVGILAITYFLIAAYVKGAKHKDLEWQSKWDKNQLEIAESNNEYKAKIDNLESQLQSEIDRVNKDAKVKIERMQNDLVAANAVASSLRDKAKQYAANAKRCTTNTIITDLRGSSQEAAGVLADLLAKSDERSGILAKYADELEVARDACEAAYNSAKMLTDNAIGK